MTKLSPKDKVINLHHNLVNRHEWYCDAVSQHVPRCSNDKTQLCEWKSQVSRGKISN